MKTIKQLLITVVMLLCSVVANAYDFEVNGIYYNIISTSDLTVEVTNGDNKYSGEVIIPNIIIYKSRTLTVVSIGERAFTSCESLTSIEIPNSVTSIGSDAFSGCRGLTSIEIPNSVTSIGDYAFSYCRGLTSIVIPNSVTSIGDYAFSYCRGLTSIEIPNSVTSIGDYAFHECTGLTSIEIPNSVTSIGNAAFYGCTSLKDLRIEDGGTTLSLGYNWCYSSTGEGLFGGCPLETLYLGRNMSYDANSKYGYSPFCNITTLTSAMIGNSVTIIGEYAFSGCSGLTNITIPNSVSTIENFAFGGCTSLKELHIEDGETVLELGYQEESDKESGSKGLFYDCPLEKIHLGRNVNYKIHEDRYYYGCSPFYNRKDLKTLTISNYVTKIGSNAFEGCSSLSEIIIPNSVKSIGYEAFHDCTCLTSVIIGNSVTSIGNNAFENCSGLKKVEFRCAKIDTWFNGTSIEEVVIGNSVTRIFGGAFKDCSSLTNIHLLGKKPPYIDSSNTFAESQYATLTIYVPQDALEAYQAADVWKDFWDIREEGTTEMPGVDVEVKKCATPVITYSNSGLDITSETDGAEIHTYITCSDVDSFNGGRIDLSATYNITAYATKSGYLNSETVTATLCWIAVSGDSEDNSIIKVEAMPVLITCNNGTINICGGKEGAEVVVYTTSGVAVGNATITNGNATISTGLAKGEIAVISIAGKGIKVVMQ